MSENPRLTAIVCGKRRDGVGALRELRERGMRGRKTFSVTVR